MFLEYALIIHLESVHYFFLDSFFPLTLEHNQAITVFTLKWLPARPSFRLSAHQALVFKESTFHPALARLNPDRRA
jgi:hypothetical protein